MQRTTTAWLTDYMEGRSHEARNKANMRREELEEHHATYRSCLDPKPPSASPMMMLSCQKA